MGKPTAEREAIASDMRDILPQDRERRIALGVLSGVVVDARRRFYLASCVVRVNNTDIGGD